MCVSVLGFPALSWVSRTGVWVLGLCVFFPLSQRCAAKRVTQTAVPRRSGVGPGGPVQGWGMGRGGHVVAYCDLTLFVWECGVGVFCLLDLLASISKFWFLVDFRLSIIALLVIFLPSVHFHEISVLLYNPRGFPP